MRDIIIKAADKGDAIVVWRAYHLKIYFLHKIHKPNNPGWPIFSASSYPTELIASYLDKIMAPFVKTLPS